MTDDAEKMIARAPLRYSGSVDGYAEYWSPVIRSLARRLLEALPWDRAGRILDVGTGTGALIPDILGLAPTARVVGIDPSLGMLEPMAPHLSRCWPHSWAKRRGRRH